MAITSLAAAIQEINATNLTDGQQIKQLLQDLVTFLNTLAPQGGPTELTDSTGGTASTTLTASTSTYSATIVNNNFASLNAHVNALASALVDAGVLTST